MYTTDILTSVASWLEWFEQHKLASCYRYLRVAYELEPADADVLINTARLQVFRHWQTIENPLAYFWQTLRNAVRKYRHFLERERQLQEGYATQCRFHTVLRERTACQVEDVLSQVKSRQRQLLMWFMQGYGDTFVASQLHTTPHAVQQARYAVYVELRKCCSHRFEAYTRGVDRF
jgi:hypothetical protein